MTGSIVLDLVLALILGAAIFWVLVRLIGMISTPPPEVDPDDVIPFEQHFRCSVCGTEVTMKVASVTETSAPKHCREEMVAVWRPG